MFLFSSSLERAALCLAQDLAEVLWGAQTTHSKSKDFFRDGITHVKGDDLLFDFSASLCLGDSSLFSQDTPS